MQSLCGYRAAVIHPMLDFELSSSQMSALDRLDQAGGTDNPQEYKWR